MPTQKQRSAAGRFFGGPPFEYDLLSQDLDSHYPKFTRKGTIHWGIIVGALPGSWDTDNTIRGIDWVARFAPPGTVKILHPRGERMRISWRLVKQHCVLIAIDTGSTSMNEARDIGRPATRAMLALLRREVPVLLPDQLLWEGALVFATSGKLKTMATGLEIEVKDSITPERLHRLGLRMTKISAAGIPKHVSRALGWLTLARAARARSEMFIHLWLAILTLAGHGQSKWDDDMKRITKYTRSMTYGPNVVSPLIVTEINERLHAAKRARHRLVHRADDSGITEELLRSLEDDAMRFVDFELAKIGTPIIA